jgi:hypothetical protein
MPGAPAGTEKTHPLELGFAIFRKKTGGFPCKKLCQQKKNGEIGPSKSANRQWPIGLKKYILDQAG